MTNQKNRLLNSTEIAGVCGKFSRPENSKQGLHKLAEMASEAQDTKGVKAILEWLAEFTEGDVYGDEKTGDYMLFQIPLKEVPEALKRGIDGRH